MSPKSLSNFLGRYVRDEHIRILIKNAGLIFSGNGLAAILGLVSAAAAARGLGIEQFGVLALMIAYVQLIGGLSDFNTWQALIRFGSIEIKRDRQRYGAFIGISFITDLASHFIGFLVSVSIVLFASARTGWFEGQQPTVLLLSITILFGSTGAAVGALRLAGDFKILSIATPLSSMIILFGYGLSYWNNWSIESYIISRLVASFSASLLVYIACIRRLLTSGLHLADIFRWRAVHNSFRSYFAFLGTTNVNSTVNLIAKQSDILIVGAVLGNAAAGVYRIVKHFAQFPLLLQGPFYQAIYPQLAALRADGLRKEFKSLAVQSSFLAGGANALYWLGFLLLGKLLISLIFGQSYVDAWLVGLAYLAGTFVGSATLSLQPALLSFGKPGLSFQAHLIANVVFLVMMFSLLPQVGLLGAGVSFLVYYLVWASVMWRNVSRCFKSEETWTQA